MRAQFPEVVRVLAYLVHVCLVRYLTYSYYFTLFSLLIIYMKKFLDSDWLREMQFLGNTMQKKGNSVQEKGNSVQKRGKQQTILIG